MSPDGPFKKYPIRTWGPLVCAAICVIICATLVGYKVIALGYRVAKVDNQEYWMVKLFMDVKGDRDTVRVRAMAPINTSRQKISDLSLLGAGSEVSQDDGFGVWEVSPFKGSARFVMTFKAQTKNERIPIPLGVGWSELENPPVDLLKYLENEERIQAFHEEIRKKGEELKADAYDVAGFIRSLYDFIHDDISYIQADGPTDALTCLRLDEASCNGKNRLLVAIARSQGLPARMCKGLILENDTTKSKTHAWSEVFVDGKWVPMCPTNGHFAQTPENYLEYPKIDDAMFSHTKNIKFDRAFRIERNRVTPEQAFLADLDKPSHILYAWGSMGQSDFSLSLLMIILTVPVGVTLVSFLRTVVGLVPFGTFLPALIAVSFRDTGIGWGLLQFAFVILLCAGINEALKRFHLLHFPRITVIFCCVVITVLALAVLANQWGFHQAAKVGMFPLAVLTLTIERFSLVRETEDLGIATKRLAISLLCACICYLPMMDFTVQSYVLLFPELLLLCIAVNLVIGMYTKLRLTELIRFRLLLFQQGGRVEV